jgi:hypothetical protein
VFEPFGGASGSDVGIPLIFDGTEITPGLEDALTLVIVKEHEDFSRPGRLLMQVPIETHIGRDLHH